MKVFATGLVAAAMAAPEAPQQATPLSIGSPAIIGGKNASDGQFPWQVTLARSSGSHYCGGSILAPTKVMCAAHCKQSTNTWTAGAGSATRSRQRQTKSGRSQTAHPSYNSRTIDYDYMVLTLSSSFSYDNYVKPIGLVSTSNASENTGTCTTSGYGYSQHIGGNPGTIASTLQWTNIQCITDSQCKRVWSTSTITARQQCADTNGVTSCMGDSGGPLTIKQGGQDVLLGNVSWGHSKCSTSGYPAVYSRNAVPAIHSWIKTNAGI